MSDPAIQAIPLVVSYDPRLEQNGPLRVVKRGARSTDYDVVNPEGSQTSTTRHTFRIIMSDQRLKRRVDIRVQDLTINFSVAANASNDTNLTVLNAGYDAPRPWLLARNMQNIRVRINGNTIDTSPYENYTIYSRTNDELALDRGANSGTPNYLDNVQEYSQLEDAKSAARNPLGLGSSVDHARGSFPIRIASNNNLSVGSAATAQVVIPEITEPLLVPMMYWGQHKDADAFQNIFNNAEVDIQWVNGMQYNLWSHNDPAGMVGDFSVTSFSWANVQLLADKFDEPPTFPAPPATAFYPKWRFDRDETSVTANAGTSYTNVNSGNYQFSAIPHMFYIYIADSLQSRFENGAEERPERFARIDSISIKMDGTTGKLSEASPQQLYQLSLKNGVDMTWSDWYPQSAANAGEGALYDRFQGCGSLLAVSPIDLGLEDGYAPGVNKEVNFSVQISYTNVGSVNFTEPKLVIAGLYDGVLGLNANGSSFVSENILGTPQDVLRDVSGDKPVVSHVALKNMIGGKSNFWKGLKGMALHALPVLEKAALAAAPAVGSLAVKALMGAGKGGRRKRGGIVIGGNVEEDEYAQEAPKTQSKSTRIKAMLRKF